MTLHTYACENCDFKMPDVEQAVTDPPLLMECPSCKHSMRRRVTLEEAILKIDWRGNMFTYMRETYYPLFEEPKDKPK